MQFTDADLLEPLGGVALDNATAPGDFDPAAVNSVRFQVSITGAGFGDDRWTHLHRASLRITASTFAASVDEADAPNLANQTVSSDATDTSVDQTLTVAEWEGLDGGSDTTSTQAAFATNQRSMGADGATLTIPVGGMTVTIDYAVAEPAAPFPPHQLTTVRM
jgi:hypothetical protein